MVISRLLVTQVGNRLEVYYMLSTVRHSFVLGLTDIIKITAGFSYLSYS